MKSMILAACLAAARAWGLNAETNEMLSDGFKQFESKNYSDALLIFKQVTLSDPSSANAQFYVGRCYYELKNFELAQNYVSKAQALDPGNTEYRAFLEILAETAPKPMATPSAPVAELKPSPTPEATPIPRGVDRAWSALWRSAVLPGWGQAYNGQAGKGYGLGGVSAGLFAGVVTTYFLSAAAESEYTSVGAGKSQDSYDAPYGRWQNYSNMNYVFYSFFGAVYAYCLYDAAKTGHEQWSSSSAPRLGLFLMDRGMGTKLQVASF